LLFGSTTRAAAVHNGGLAVRGKREAGEAKKAVSGFLAPANGHWGAAILREGLPERVGQSAHCVAPLLKLGGEIDVPLRKLDQSGIARL
jgi:hypothetical protein